MRFDGHGILLDIEGTTSPIAFVHEVMFPYARLHLREFLTGSEAQEGIGFWMRYYNEDRPHSSLGGRTPDEAYHEALAA